MRICIKCHAEKQDDEFSKGSGNTCKCCVREYQRKYKKTPKGAAAQRRYQKTEKVKAYLREYKIKNREKLKKYHKNRYLLREYGIGLDDYNRMHYNQGGSCAICGRHESMFSKVLAVDHDHTTGAIRELLCTGCNQALGLFGENTESMTRAIQYLEKHRISGR